MGFLGFQTPLLHNPPDRQAKWGFCELSMGETKGIDGWDAGPAGFFPPREATVICSIIIVICSTAGGIGTVRQDCIFKVHARYYMVSIVFPE